MLRYFTEHPAEIGESYWHHLSFTVTMALRLMLIGLVLIIHGLLPFAFTRWASAQIEKLYARMHKRIPPGSALEYDI